MPGTTISSTAVNSDLSDIAANGLSKCLTIDGQNPPIGQIGFINGTAAAPSITFISDKTTGIYYPGTGQLGFSAGGIAGPIVNTTSASGNVLTTPFGAFYSPIGSIVDWPGATAPTGWFLCYGQTYSSASYPELFLVLGSTTIPDLRGRLTAGVDNMGGVAANRIGTVVTDSGTIVGTTLFSAGGSSTHTLTAAESAILTYATSGGNPVFNTSATNFTFIGLGVGGNIGYQASGGTNIGTVENGTSVSISGQTTTANASGGAHSLLNPMIMMNKIIFAGRP